MNDSAGHEPKRTEWSHASRGGGGHSRSSRYRSDEPGGQCDELAAFHSITSSGRASSVWQRCAADGPWAEGCYGGQVTPSGHTSVSGAARELFEELGVLAVRGGETLTKGQRVSLLDDLESGRMSWPALLDHYELYLDAHDFTFVGRWVTPPFNARRFDTWFFLVTCPSRQEPNVIAGELASGEWIRAQAAYDRWMNDEVVAVPPTLHALKALAAGITPDLVGRDFDRARELLRSVGYETITVFERREAHQVPFDG